MPEKQSQTSVLFDEFVAAKTFKGIYSAFLALCEHLELKPFVNHQAFYGDLKSKVNSWKAKSLWAKLDKRANRWEYNKGTACLHTNVLVIGAGPCGLRAAIEVALLGAKVVVVEKRNSFSRNNVLHLWPFLINDLRNLGAKKFFGKFCAGAIDHISIRQLQVILMKVALLVGVELHYDVMFEELEEPPEDQDGPEKIGWRARLNPRDHPVSEFEFDVVIGADGRRNTLPGFARKEFRGKLAIAITANFINRHTAADARVEEISGVAFIFNQQFFQDLKGTTGIDLENIVYYKDDTHYFVMTAKKQSLIQKGVILEDLPDTARLLAPENVNHDKLQIYAKEAADFSTKFQLPSLDFALNHYGLPDIAMFDFTSIFQAKNAACVRDRNGHKLLLALCGDTLLEPFWPTGSGCARGWLGVFDAAWMVRSWASGKTTPLQVLAERDSIYRLLAQTTPENLHKGFDAYGLDPSSRYPILNLNGVSPTEVLWLYDTKDEELKKQFETLKRKQTPNFQRQGSMMRSGKLLLWCQRVTESYSDVKIENMTSSWRNGLAMCAIIHRYRPHLIDFDSLKAKDMIENNQLAFKVAEEHLGIPPAMSAKDMASFEGPDKLSMVAFISRIYDIFKDEVPEGSTTNMNSGVISEEMQLDKSSKKSLFSRITKHMKKSSRKSHDQDKIPEEGERPPPLSPHILKRKSQDRKEIDSQRKRQILAKSSQSIATEDDSGAQGKVSGLREQLTAQFMTIAGLTDLDGTKENGSAALIGSNRSSTCFFCKKHVYVMERMTAEGLFFHRDCFRCQHCDTNLKVGTYCFAQDAKDSSKGKFYCRLHFTEKQRREEELEKRRAEEARRREEVERRLKEERKAIHTIAEDPQDQFTVLRIPPPKSPSADDSLSLPMEKKYKATPERIVLQNMYDQIHRLTEEEQASYNLVDEEDERDGDDSGGESDESSGSEELNEVQLKWMKDKLKGLEGVDLDDSEEEYTDEEMDSDEESSEEDESEGDGDRRESRQVTYHIDRVSAMTNAKMAWLSDTSPIRPLQASAPEPVAEDKPMEGLQTEKAAKDLPLKESPTDNAEQDLGLSTLERKVATGRKEENKSWRDKMAKNYASFEDDLPYMRSQSREDGEEDLEMVEEDGDRDDRTEEPQHISLEESNDKLPHPEAEFGDGEVDSNWMTDSAEMPDQKPSNNSSFTISTPESSVSDVPTSPRSSLHNLSDGRGSTSPTKHLSLPRQPESSLDSQEVPAVPSINLGPDDGGRTVESSTDVQKSPSPTPSPRSRSPVPSPRGSLPEPAPRGPPPQPPSSQPDEGIPPSDATENVRERSERKPYQSHYSRSNRGIRSPMLAAGNSSSLAFSKIPGMDDIASPEGESSEQPRATRRKLRPDSPIQLSSPMQTDQAGHEREVPSSRLRSGKLEEITGTSPMLDVSSDGNFETPHGEPPRIILSPQSESSTDPGFHDTSTHISEGAFSPDGSSEQWHSASGGEETPTFQYENGIPRSESHSKERKSRISLIRREKKNRKGVRRSKGSSLLAEGEESPVPEIVEESPGKQDEMELPTGSSSEKKKKSGKKRRKRSKQRDRKEDYILAEGETEALDEREKRRSKVPDIEGLIKGGNDAGEKQLPRLIRKLTVDPALTAAFDVDDSSSDEEEEGVIQVASEEEGAGEVKLRKGKGRRMWGKKFKAFNTKANRDQKEKRKLEEEELNAKLTRRVQREARRQHRQQQLKRHRMAQEIQRQLQEADVKQRELEDRGVEVEKALRNENGEEGVPEQDLMAQWFSLVNEKNALVRFESELMAQAWELELEDRHSHLEQEIRTRLAIDESKKSEEDEKVEALLLEEMLEVVEQRDAIVAWLEEERLNPHESESVRQIQRSDSIVTDNGEKSEDQDIESMMLQKGLLTAVH